MAFSASQRFEVYHHELLGCFLTCLFSKTELFTDLLNDGMSAATLSADEKGQ
jgi:hypothetical protein